MMVISRKWISMAAAMACLMFGLADRARAGTENITFFVSGTFETTGGGSDVDGGSFDGQFVLAYSYTGATPPSPPSIPAHGSFATQTISYFLVNFYSSTDILEQTLDSTVGGNDNSSFTNQANSYQRGNILIENDDKALNLYFSVPSNTGIDLNNDITIPNYSDSSPNLPSNFTDASGTADVGGLNNVGAMVSQNPPAPAIPEPSSIILAAIGLIGMLGLANARRSA
jgi:hypothetical protein